MTDARKIYGNISFELKAKENLGEYLDRQELAYKYFYHLNKSSKILNDPKALTALNYTHINAIDFKSLEQIDCSLKYDFVKILILLIENSYQRIIECITFQDDSDINQRNRIGSMTTALISLNILERFTYFSSKFSNKFHQDNGIKTLFTFINNRKIQDHLIHIETQSQDFVLMKAIFKSLFNSMSNLAKHATSHKYFWSNLNSIENLKVFLEKFNSFLDLKIYICSAIAYLLEENDLDHLNELVKEIIQLIIKLVSSISKLMSESKINRLKVKIHCERKYEKVAFISSSGILYNLIDLINVSYKLASLDQLKQPLFFKYKLCKYLPIIIYNSNETELELSLDLLFQLCYDKQVCLHVKNDLILFGFIEALSSHIKITNKIIKKHASGILWLIEERLNVQEETIINQVVNIDKFMIIAQSDNNCKDLCLMIEKELDKLNLKTWIHSNDKTDDFKLIKNELNTSYFVLISINDNYLTNTSFRLELEYAFKLNKKIIPLIMQKNFKSNGWLGNFIQNEIFFNFNKYEFNLCFNGLIDFLNETKLQIKYYSPIEKIFKWNENETEKWLQIQNINMNLLNRIKPLNGKILYEYYLMSLDAPEYFYDYILDVLKDDSLDINEEDIFSKKITIKDFVLFKNKIKILFEF